MGAVSRRWEITIPFVFLDFTSTCGKQPFRACSHDPGQLIASGQLTDSRVDFASAHGLTPVTDNMNFSLPGGGLPVVKHWVIRLAEVTFLHENRIQKLSQGKSSLAHAHY